MSAQITSTLLLTRKLTPPLETVLVEYSDGSFGIHQDGALVGWVWQSDALHACVDAFLSLIHEGKPRRCTSPLRL
jgi:hypothetical protein